MTVALDWPADLWPSTCSFWLEANALVNVSPISRATQSVGRPGSRWRCDLTFDARDAVYSSRIDACINLLEGPSSEVTLFDFRRPIPRGSAGLMENPILTTFTDGTEFTDGYDFVDAYAAETPFVYLNAAAGDEVLTIQGFGGLEHALAEGDYVGVGGYLYMVMYDARADAMGRLSATVRPRLRSALTPGQTIVVDHPRARFRLADNSQGVNRTSAGFVSAYTISFLESLP